MRACLCDVVDVEARVDLKDCGISVIELIASVVVRGVGIRENREWPRRWWECQVLVQILCVVAKQVSRLESLNEAVVQVEHILPVSQIWSDDHILLDSAVTNDWVVDRDSLQVDVWVGRSNECVCDVWHVVACIALASQEEVPSVWCQLCITSTRDSILPLNTKCLDELLIKANELLTEPDFIDDVWHALCVANSDRLLDPQHVGQVHPSVRIQDRRQCASFPGKWTILSEQATERRTTRSYPRSVCDLNTALLAPSHLH